MTDATDLMNPVPADAMGTTFQRLAGLMASLSLRPAATDSARAFGAPLPGLPPHERPDRNRDGAPWRSPGTLPHLGYAAAIVGFLARD